MSALFKGKKIMLRALELEDVDLLYEWENNDEIWSLSTTLAPFSKHILEQYVMSGNDLYANKQLRLMICLSEGKAIGCLDLFDFEPYHKRAGVGILIADKDEREHGYGSEALDLLINYSFHVLELHQLYCNIIANNEGSMRLFQKKGFKLVGTKKQWIRNEKSWNDEHLFQLIA